MSSLFISFPYVLLDRRSYILLAQPMLVEDINCLHIHVLPACVWGRGNSRTHYSLLLWSLALRPQSQRATTETILRSCRLPSYSCRYRETKGRALSRDARTVHHAFQQNGSCFGFSMRILGRRNRNGSSNSSSIATQKKRLHKGRVMMSFWRMPSRVGAMLGTCCSQTMT